MMDTFNGALTLNQALLREMRDSPRVVERGLLVVLLVGLLVGGVNGVQVLLGTLNPERQLSIVRTQIEQSIEQQAQAATAPEQREILAIMRKNLEPGLAIAADVMALPTVLPRPVSALTRALGVIASQPLRYLGQLLLWVVFTHIAARWMGGTGKIQQMLGLGALSVAPHALDALAFIPAIGGGLSLIATVWGIVILTFGTSVAHQLTPSRAALAVLFFPMLALIVGVMACCVLFILVISSAGALAG